MKPLLVTSGEPAGIGPDLCLALAGHVAPCVVIGDLTVLERRARELNLAIEFDIYQKGFYPVYAKNRLTILPLSCPAPVIAGQLNPLNAVYVVEMLSQAIRHCLSEEFSGLVTAPVHKGVINQAGISFTGHTEFFAHQCDVTTVVMMLASPSLKVALVTTHLPLKDVPGEITHERLLRVISQVDESLRQDFSIACPKIVVAGLNPHAGEGGYLGVEEQTVIAPALRSLQKNGLNVIGPVSADTMFSADHLKDCDVFVAMYHDQGLPALKYAGFGQAVNITLGLPIIRTSVDHGTALELAGTGLAKADSLLAAYNMALSMVKSRQ